MKFLVYAVVCLLQAFSKFNDAFKPLLEGCLINRDHWQELAESRTKQNHDTEDKENTDKDREEEKQPSS